jgi:hypothetical protein
VVEHQVSTVHVHGLRRLALELLQQFRREAGAWETQPAKFLLAPDAPAAKPGKVTFVN